jgi:pyruvate,orthophosphate dikinase
LEAYTKEGVLEQTRSRCSTATASAQLIRMAKERGRKTNPALEVGICGEHGGDPSSVEFCHQVGLDYVSCSPYRVPIARLAAAQAALGSSEESKRTA